jgi:hypothetical protein
MHVKLVGTILRQLKGAIVRRKAATGRTGCIGSRAQQL